MPDYKKSIECRSIDGTIEYREDAASAKPDAKCLRGYAARFNVIADLYWFDEEILPGAFSESIGKDDIRALINHDPSLILGRNRAKTLELFEDNAGLYSIIDPPETNAAKDLVISVDRGDVSQMSFQFIVDEEKWIWSDSRNEKNDLRQIIKATLRDVSIVTFPAYVQTDVSYRFFEARSAESIWKSANIRRNRPLHHYYNRYLTHLAGYN